MLIPLIVACALFMENLDSSVVATSLPVIAVDLGVDPVSLKLAFTSYLISIAVFTPLSGWLADKYGARTVFRLAIVVFTLGSVLCGFAGSLQGFVGARIVQGIGGSMMVPVGRLILLKSVDKRDYLRALSWLTVPALIGPVLGPPVGGFITTYFEWRWIFWINVPIGMVGMGLVSLYIVNVREEAPRKLDLAGFLLLGFGLAGFVFGIAASGIGLLPRPLILALTGAGTLCLVGYVLHARRATNPLIDLALLGIPTLRAAILGGALFRVGIGALPFLLPLMLQVGFGLSAFQSGMITFTSAAGAMLMKLTAPGLLRRLGFRTVLVGNALLCAVLTGAVGFFTAATPIAAMVLLLLVGGFFRSLQFTAINGLGFSDLSGRQMSQATGLSSVAQQISVATGVAVAAAVLETVRGLRDDATLVADDFLPAFLVVAAISATSAVVFALLKKDAGTSVSGHAVPGRTRAAE